MKLFFLFVFLITFIGQLFADFDASLPMAMSVGDVMTQERLRRRKDPEVMLEQIQAHYIQKIFIDKIYNFDEASLLDDEDREFMGTQVNTTYHQELLKKVLAEKLAEQDLLQMKKQYLPEYKANTIVPRSF